MYPLAAGQGKIESMEWVRIRQFDSRLEAETVGHALDQYGIPFVVKSEDLGIFGPGHSGITPQGASLCVPVEYLQRVSELLSCLFQETGNAVSEPEEEGSSG